MKVVLALYSFDQFGKIDCLETAFENTLVFLAAIQLKVFLNVKKQLIKTE